MLTIAVPKGRIFEQAAPLLERAGLGPLAAEEGGVDRRIVVETQDPGVRLLIVRVPDVQTYVSYGAAQLGMVGRDLLTENPLEGVFYGADLKIACCRLCVAASKDFDYAGAIERGAHLTVATKYPRLARTFLARQGVQAEIVKLYGSMELAPLVGLSDVIVDLVASGATLKANNLVEKSNIMDVSTHLVLNQAAAWRKDSELERVSRLLVAAAQD